MNIHRVETVSTESIKALAGNSTMLPVQPLTAGPVLGQSKKDYDYASLTDDQKTQLDKQIEILNKSMVGSGKELRFKYNDEAKQLYVEVLNSQTHEVVTSLPPEFLIDLSIKMKEMIGMFIDKKV